MRLPACLMTAFLIGSCGSAAEDPAPQETEIARSLTLELPPEVSVPPKPEAEPEPQPAVPVAPPPEPEPSPKAAQRKTEPVTAEKADPTPEAAAPAAPPEESGAAAAPAEAGLVRARMPLSDAQIVRTIERIGFECGSVVGTGRQEGEGEPVFKIDCSSGASYRGTTKNGRLFFRPWTAGRSGR